MNDYFYEIEDVEYYTLRYRTFSEDGINQYISKYGNKKIIDWYNKEISL